MATYGPRQYAEAKREATHLALWAQQVEAKVAANDTADVEALCLSVEATANRLRVLTARAAAR